MPDVYNSVDPGNIIRAHLLHHRIEIEYSGNNPIYVGWTLPTFLTTDPQWRICKLEYDGSNNPLRVMWANRTNQYLFKWTDRANGAVITYTTS